MKANVKAVLAMVLVIGGFSASASAGDTYFALRQANAIQEQENLIRAGVAAGAIDKELCIFFVQSLADMKRSAYAVGSTVGGESSQLSHIIQLKTMNADECK